MADQINISKIYVNAIEDIEARVKWYKPHKGYGFLTLDDDSEEIFLHFSVLDQYGYWNVQEGDRIICVVGSGEKGRQVLSILGIKLGLREPKPISNNNYKDLEKIKGTVKWFNSVKGYGFIIPEKGGEEVFLHASLLHAMGYQLLKPGTHVLFEQICVEEKYEVTSLEVID